jgi:hypothetical protein
MDSTEAIADGLPALRRRVLWQEVLEPKASQSILRSTIDQSRRKWYDSARGAERSLRDFGGSSSSASGGIAVLDSKWLDFSREDKVSAFRSWDHGVSMMTTILSFDDRIIVYTTVVEGGLPERR